MSAIGSLWIEGSDLHWIDANDVEQSVTGTDTGNNPSASNGSIWVEGTVLHYIDANGNERTLSGTQVATSTTGESGALWVESTDLHYIRGGGTSEYKIASVAAEILRPNADVNPAANLNESDGDGSYWDEVDESGARDGNVISLGASNCNSDTGDLSFELTDPTEPHDETQTHEIHFIARWGAADISAGGGSVTVELRESGVGLGDSGQAFSLSPIFSEYVYTVPQSVVDNIQDWSNLRIWVELFANSSCTDNCGTQFEICNSVTVQVDKVWLDIS